MKKFVTIFLALYAFFMAEETAAQTQPTDTDGDGYYNISTLDHLRWVSENSNSWSWDFELDNDIDADASSSWNSGAGFSPIGNNSTKFTGVFVGNGYTISNITINRPLEDYVGLFGYVYSQTIIEGITLVRADISGKSLVGGIVGNLAGYSIVSNCSFSGSVSGENDNIGGLVGKNYYSVVSFCHSAAGVTGQNENIGGLVGQNIAGTVNNSYSSGSVSGTNSKVGGLVGFNYVGTVLNTFSKSSVTGSSSVGGLVGENSNNAVIENSYSYGAVAGSSSVGGLIGENSSSTAFDNCFWDKQKSGQDESDGGIGKTTLEMQTEQTYTSADWSFTRMWDISDNQNEKYPFLKVVSSCPQKENDTYLIADMDNLFWLAMSPTFWGEKFKLNSDIDATETNKWGGGFQSIALGGNFSGEFDGNGHSIQNLYIYRSVGRDIGLFGRIFEGNISNLELLDCEITGHRTVGGIAGTSNNNTEISNCRVTGQINGIDVAVGGIVGNNLNSSINDCNTDVEISGRNEVGGLAGNNAGPEAEIYKCYTIGNVRGNASLGGLVGVNYSAVNKCFASGDVFGTVKSGGLVGHNYSESAQILDCYAIGNVSSTSNAGGLVGMCHTSTVRRCYSTGEVSGNTFTAGLIGRIYNGKIYNSYWNTETSKFSQGLVQNGTDNTVSVVEGKTTEQMQDQTTYSNWDFTDIWQIDESFNTGYPYLEENNTKSEEPPGGDVSGNHGLFYNWVHELGGMMNISEQIESAVDDLDNIYITGHFTGTINLNPEDPTEELTATDANNIFLAKYDKNGNFFWAKLIECSVANLSMANSVPICIDDANNVYITGEFVGTGDFDPKNSEFNITSAATGNDANDIFIAKYNSNGELLDGLPPQTGTNG